jgi:hypothetical protein
LIRLPKPVAGKAGNKKMDSAKICNQLLADHCPGLLNGSWR